MTRPAAEPAATGREIAALFLANAPALFDEIARTAAWNAAAPQPAAREEWNVFALYACVRGLVAGAGFNLGTASAIDAMHEAVLESWDASLAAADSRAQLHARIASRYEEYGGIGQQGGAAGADTVTRRLGAAAARHMAGADASPEIGEIAGSLHESLAEAVAGRVRER